LPEESLLVVCPNPNCRKEFEEPILLTIRSVTPPKEYEACPYCFAKLEQEPDKQKEIPEPEMQKESAEPEASAPEAPAEPVLETEKDSGSKIFDKVRSLIPSNGETKKEEPKEAKDKPEVKKESDFSGCPESFGYLANRPSDVPIPQACLSCPKMVDCMLSPRE
jgi:hypothetical protein